ncbi:hypothetical protein KI387_023834 [Taxus chinensis]|uniref:Calmodulin-binding domain-containing protein n=1 Tax=Taxus chinensis TaxID=29808 RepID=A0AA38G2T5_TAXCH|nr:hypothetical protein KI387_023834 [Taxus chinensis]
MVVKDTRVVNTGGKSSAERAPLRRLSSLENKGFRKTPTVKKGGTGTGNGRIIKEMKGIVDDKVVLLSNPVAKTPHYRRPTANSSNQARVHLKPLPASSPFKFSKVRRFPLGSQSPDAGKYVAENVRKSSLLGSKSSDRSPVKISGLKLSKSLEKTSVKINGLKPSKAIEKTPGLLKPKTPRSGLCSKPSNVARDTCSSNCKHVVKVGGFTISPEPRCPYHYCSLNHLDHVEPPSVKQFLATRRRFLRTQKSFRWVGLTPVSGDTGDGVETECVADTGQKLWVVGHVNDTKEEDALGVGSKSDDDPRPGDCQIVDCHDYNDDGLLFESGECHGNDVMQIDKSSMDESNANTETDESVELLAENEDVKNDNQKFDVEATGRDMASNSHDYDQFAEIWVNVSNVKVRADESMEAFEEREDGEDDHRDLHIEVSANDMVSKWGDCDQIAGSLVDHIDVMVRAEELFAEDADLKDDTSEVDVEASAHNLARDFHDYGQSKERQCFIQISALVPECWSEIRPDGLLDVSFSEVNSCLKDEVRKEDDCNNYEGGPVSEVCDNNHIKQFVVCQEDDYDRTEDTEMQCSVQVNALGIECKSHTELDGMPDVSFSPGNNGLKDVVEEEYDRGSGRLEGLLVSEVCACDHVELSAGCDDDYDQIEAAEQQCFIQVNIIGPECDSPTESDGLPDASFSEASSILIDEVKEEDDCVSGSSECQSVSDVSADDHIKHSASCKDDYNQIEDTEQRCFLPICALGTNCSSHTEPNNLSNVSFSEVNSCRKDEVKEEYHYVSVSYKGESATEVHVNGHTKQFAGWEDDQSCNGGAGNEITDHDGIKCDEFDSSCSGDSKLNCYIQDGDFGMQCSSNTDVDSLPYSSDNELGAVPKQQNKEECVRSAGIIFDGFDDDYNLTSLFAECKDDSSRNSESNCPVKFSIHLDVDSPMDKVLLDSSLNSKFEEGEDINTLAGREDGCASKIDGNDFEEQYSESEEAINEILRTSSDYDDNQAMETELFNDMIKERCDISGISLNGSVTECESLKIGRKGYRNIAEENKNKPHRLKFRQGHVHPFDNQISEAEKVDLRHQMTEDRRAAHEWMLDYALTKIVNKLSPFRQRKVELLVEAFETVTPLSKHEANDSPHATRDFTCSRPIQACS